MPQYQHLQDDQAEMVKVPIQISELDIPTMWATTRRNQPYKVRFCSVETGHDITVIIIVSILRASGREDEEYFGFIGYLFPSETDEVLQMSRKYTPWWNILPQVYGVYNAHEHAGQEHRYLEVNPELAPWLVKK